MRHREIKFVRVRCPRCAEKIRLALVTLAPVVVERSCACGVQWRIAVEPTLRDGRFAVNSAAFVEVQDEEREAGRAVDRDA